MFSFGVRADVVYTCKNWCKMLARILRGITQENYFDFGFDLLTNYAKNQ